MNRLSNIFNQSSTSQSDSKPVLWIGGALAISTLAYLYFKKCGDCQGFKNRELEGQKKYELLLEKFKQTEADLKNTQQAYHALLKANQQPVAKLSFTQSPPASQVQETDFAGLQEANRLLQDQLKQTKTDLENKQQAYHALLKTNQQPVTKLSFTQDPPTIQGQETRFAEQEEANRLLRDQLAKNNLCLQVTQKKLSEQKQAADNQINQLKNDLVVVGNEYRSLQTLYKTIESVVSNLRQLYQAELEEKSQSIKLAQNESNKLQEELSVAKAIIFNLEKKLKSPQSIQKFLIRCLRLEAELKKNAGRIFTNRKDVFFEKANTISKGGCNTVYGTKNLGKWPGDWILRQPIPDLPPDTAAQAWPSALKVQYLKQQIQKAVEENYMKENVWEVLFIPSLAYTQGATGPAHYAPRYDGTLNDLLRQQKAQLQTLCNESNAQKKDESYWRQQSQNEAIRMIVMVKLLAAVNALHCLGVSHSDIKAENVLFKMNGNDIQVGLSDFDTIIPSKDGGIPPSLTIPSPELWAANNRWFSKTNSLEETQEAFKDIQKELLPADIYALGLVFAQLMGLICEDRFQRAVVGDERFYNLDFARGERRFTIPSRLQTPINNCIANMCGPTKDRPSIETVIDIFKNAWERYPLGVKEAVGEFLNDLPKHDSLRCVSLPQQIPVRQVKWIPIKNGECIKEIELGDHRCVRERWIEEDGRWVKKNRFTHRWVEEIKVNNEWVRANKCERGLFQIEKINRWVRED